MVQANQYEVFCARPDYGLAAPVQWGSWMRPERRALFWFAALVVLLILLAFLKDALLPFAVGAVIAYFLNPLADALQRLGFGRTIAALLIIGLATLVLAAAVFFLLPIAAEQVRQLAQSLPGDLNRIRSWLEVTAQQHFGDNFPSIKASLEKALGELAQGSSGIVSTIAQALWSRGLALFNLMTLVLVTPVVSFYLLRDWHTMIAKIRSWLPREQEQSIVDIATDVDAAVAAFVRGQGTICLLLGALYAIALTLIGLRYGLVIGLATGLLGFIPMVGWALGLVVALLVALTQSWPDTGLAIHVLAVFVAGMALDSGVLSPLIVGQRVGLHPIWLMLALFVFGALFGLLGALIAVPVAAAIAVLIRFARDRYLESSLYLGTSPAAAGPSAPLRTDT